MLTALPLIMNSNTYKLTHVTYARKTKNVCAQKRPPNRRRTSCMHNSGQRPPLPTPYRACACCSVRVAVSPAAGLNIDYYFDGHTHLPMCTRVTSLPESKISVAEAWKMLWSLAESSARIAKCTSLLILYDGKFFCFCALPTSLSMSCSCLPRHAIFWI